MRVLLGCSLGGLGHLTPVVAVARALGRLGHDTIVLVPPSLAEAAADAGVAFRVGGQPPHATIDQMWERVRTGPPEAVAGLLDRELFADRCTAAMLASAAATCDDWRPRLVVREPCEYATAVAAHRAGIAQFQIGISQAAIEHRVLEMVADTLERYTTGVAAAIAAAPYLCSFPVSLDPSPWSDTRRFRQPAGDPGPLPHWWPTDTRPLVYVTFGTVLGHLPEARSVFRTALDAVGQLPVRALVTVGRAIDPAALGPIPHNVHVEQWVPQNDILQRASLVVCHGGSGTTFAALAAGVPLVMCPLFADQAANAALVHGSGAGVALEAQNRAPGALSSLGPDDVAPLRDAMGSVLRDPRYQQAARRVAHEISLNPTLEETIAQLLDSRPTAGS
ncbi:MAG: glycosyltransferase [Solirubrobacteraceae bacterium]